MTPSDLLESTIKTLTERLPQGWAVQPTALGGETEAGDLIIKGPGAASQTVLVEVKTTVTARDVQLLMGGPWRRWRRQAGDQPILVVAPYIGRRAREVLIQEGVGYLDLTGNIRISLTYPGLYIETQGADRDPAGAKPRVGLRGAKVGAVVRALADAKPPYSATQIARAASVNEGYLSRILDTLRDEGLIERDGAGPITEVDWPTMLRRRAQTLDLFRTPGASSFIARGGTSAVLQSLRGESSEPQPTITGSFAASRLAPVAAPTLLVVYTMDPSALARKLDLLPADAGADTILVRPDNHVVFSRVRLGEGLTWAAESQVAIDCLAGSGRMPAEGEAVIDWMRANEAAWRAPSIMDLLP